MALEEFAHYFGEAKIPTKERNKLDDSQFGIPSLRKYPLTDEKHVLQALRFFNKAPTEHKKELALNIQKRGKELDMEWWKWFYTGATLAGYKNDLSKKDQQTVDTNYKNENGNGKTNTKKNKYFGESDEPIPENDNDNNQPSTVDTQPTKSLAATEEANKCLISLKDVKYDNSSPQNWILRTPDEVIIEKLGNCHDTALYVYNKLDEFAGHPVEKGVLFFIEYNSKNMEGNQTHSVCYEQIDGGICIIEHSWEEWKGTFPYTSINEYIQVARNNWKFSGGCNALFVTEMKNYDKIKPGMNLKQYVDVAMKNEEIISESYTPTGDNTSGTSDFDEDGDSDPDDCFTESGVSNGLINAKLIAARIHEKVQKDSKPPTGNQNCQVCVWCAEAQFRGRTDMPRPVYSPRDPVLNIPGESIVIHPRVFSMKSGFDDVLDILADHPYARFYCHAKWKEGNGGHEFIIITEDEYKCYIMDPQQGTVDKFLETHSYIKDLKWEDSYLARMDDAEFNETVLRDFNTEESIVPWDAKLDIPYMLEHGMISKEEAEQYWKDHPDEAPNDRHFLSYEELDRMSESKNIFTSGDFAKYGKDVDLTDARGPIQESWNDMKRGVNPHSKTLWFHISQSDKHEGKVFTPRVPEYLTKTKFGKDDPYYEDMEIPRVCFSPSIEGALHAITSPGDRIVMGGREYYVYIPEKPINQYKRITNKELIDRKLVFDAKYTKECWITEPVKLILYGTIMVDQVSKVKLKPSVTGDAKLSVASFKWHWQVKPQAIKTQGHEYYAWNDEEDNKKTKKKKDKPVKEEYNMSDFVRDPSLLKMILEEDEPKEDEGDAIDTDTDENNGSVETTEIEAEVELGTDESGEQNQYNPEEVTRINQLINSEMSAVSEYFNAAKESKEPNLMRLYSDIGDEERFHLEQLLYAKSMVTGEEYEPQDPKVKKEYKELLDLGLDEETAMTTAIDKVGLMPKEEEMSDDEEEDLKESFNMISILSSQTQVMLESIDTSNITDEMYNNSMQFLEQMYISEEVYNLNTKEGQKALGTKSPIRIIWNAFKAVYNFVIAIVRKAKLAFQKIRIKNREKWAWLKRHGIKGIFQSGMSLYFWNDRTGKYEIGDGIRYLQMVHLMNERVIKAASLNVNTSNYNIDKYIDSIVNACKGSKVEIEVKPVSVPSIQKGMNDLNSATLTKSKVIITDENEAMLEELFFGYTDQGYQIMEKEGDNSKNIKMSFNVYNQLNYLLSAFESVSNETKDIIEALVGMEGKPNTVYATNNKAYNECVAAMNVTQKALNMFTKAVSSDIQTCLNVNTGLKDAMQKSDAEGNSQAAKEFNQNKQNAQTAGQEAKQNTKNENTPPLSPR